MINAQKTKSGFTIVEILIVIVVIAILAAVVLVAYSGVRESAVDSMLKSGVSSVAQKLETYNVKHGSYPSGIGDIGIIDTDTIKYQYDGPSGSNTYCLSVTSPQSNSKAYHTISGNTSPEEGVCEGHVGPGEDEGEEVFSFARTVKSDGPLGLTVAVGEEWSAAEISWTPQEGAQRYELQSRNPAYGDTSTRNFNYRNMSDGSGSCGGGCSAPYSRMIPSNTTSLTWTSPLTGVPASSGQSLEYRLRYELPGGSLSDWETIQLSYPVSSNDDTRPVADFTVTPNTEYSSVEIKWSRSPNFSPDMSKVYYEVESRNPASGSTSVKNFNYRNMSDGSGGCGGGCSAPYSRMIPYAVTSMTWTDITTGVPTKAGQNFEYRIRVRIDGEKSYYSGWSDVAVVSYPIQGNADVPAPSGFSVLPNSNYTNVTLSWGRVSNFSPKMDEVFYEIQSRNPASGSTSVKNFSYRNMSDGSGGCGGWCVAPYSMFVPHDTTSLTWTDTINAVPASVGQTFEYQMRIRVTGEKTYYSEWSSATVAHPIQSDSSIPMASNFNVTPSPDYTSVTLSWGQVPNFTPNMGQVFYEVQSRNPAYGDTSTRNFNYRNMSDGSGGCGGGCSAPYSRVIPYNTTSLTWTDTNTGVPSSGRSLEYRMRIRATGEKTYYSDWSPVVTVTR